MSERAAVATGWAQAWIELRSEDPEALSALAVAMRLEGEGSLRGLRRLRLIELGGSLPERSELESLLASSTRFYNPHKERCTVRVAGEEPAPVAADERLVLVVERGAERLAAAERWWLHETGARIEVREGVVWAVRFAAEASRSDPAEALARLRDRRHGLLCNPHAQDCRIAGQVPPLPWLGAAAEGPPRGGES